MIKIDGDWLLNYLKNELNIEYSDGNILYNYLKEWDSDYIGIVKRFRSYPPMKSIPAIMYGLSITRPTGILEMGRATHRLTLSYGIANSAKVVFDLLENGALDEEFLECLRGDPKQPNTNKRVPFFEKFFDKIMERDFERYLDRTGQDLKTGPFARRKTCLILYMRTCALAALNDMILASDEEKSKHSSYRDKVLDILEYSVQGPKWQNTCERGTMEYDEIQEISRDIARNKYSYYWDNDCLKFIELGDNNG